MPDSNNKTALRVGDRYRKGERLWEVDAMSDDGHGTARLVGKIGTSQLETAALVAEIERLRAAIKTALGFYQVTHIHAALRDVADGEE